MKTLKSRKRNANSVNAGSMADIAFLLLIFFLVTTTIAEDKGIMVRLPPYSIDDISQDIPSRNVFNLYVNGDDKLLARDKEITIQELKNKIKEFISNPAQKKDLASRPFKAVVVIKNDRATSYTAYLSVYNEIKAAYNELRDELSEKIYGKAYKYCNKSDQRKIRSAIPQVISESEPTDYTSL